MKHLDRIWNNRISPCQRKFVYTPHACWQFSSMAQKPGPLHKQIGNDWTSFTRGVSSGYFTSDGTISYLTTKSYAGPVSWQPLPSFANEDSDCLVMWPDSQRTFQQTRSFGLAAKPKMVPDHLLIGNALLVDLPSPGSIRSAGTQEYQWPMLCSWQETACFGDKSQRRNATAERFASQEEEEDV